MLLKELSLALCKCRTIEVNILQGRKEAKKVIFNSDDALWKEMRVNTTLASTKVKLLAINDYDPLLCPKEFPQLRIEVEME